MGARFVEFVCSRIVFSTDASPYRGMGPKYSITISPDTADCEVDPGVGLAVIKLAESSRTDNRQLCSRYCSEVMGFAFEPLLIRVNVSMDVATWKVRRVKRGISGIRWIQSRQGVGQLLVAISASS